MKKRKLLRNVSLVALSALLVGGTAMAFTACGGSSENTISVYIFCNESDAATNRSICENWAARYGEQIGRELTIDFSYNVSDTAYFTDISNRLNSGNNIPDVMYLSPKNVVANAQLGRVLDLSSYLLASDESVAGATSIWENSLAFYGAYRGSDGRLTNASSATYNASGASGAGFYDGDQKLGIYGLPKDYSNFSMGYNRNFFTDEMKAEYTTRKATDTRDVDSHIYTSTNLTAAKPLTHTGEAGMEGVITYAVDLEDYDNPYTEEVEHINAKAGDNAPIINIGIPTTYKPFNFYQYSSYEQAWQNGDIIAQATEYYTDGDGYTVTLPGFPDETWSISDVLGTEGDKYKDPDAIYDTDMVHMVYTYAEYGALSWAMTYYLNTFAWDNDQANVLSGEGGKYYADANRYQNVYGGEQYENDFGANGYVLPWLYSNDTAYIDSTSSYTKNNEKNTGSNWGNADIETWAGTRTEDVQKMTLDGGTRTAKVQAGVDSENFIETYAAFHNHGAIWNGNSGNAGDGTTSDKGGGSGWDYFRAGAAIFYGAGTWDSATRNNVDTDTTSVGQMASPVSEKLALYSTVRNTYYKTDVEVYSNADTDKGVGEDAGTATGSVGDYAQRGTLSDGLKVYTEDEIVMNQLKRQDKWGGRMDSVGYAANGALASNEWKAEAAANLIMELTINEDAQLTLTYGGAQLPNVRQQCVDFLNYQSAGADGAFVDMIAPEGDSSGDATAWDTYYAAARAMAAAAASGSTQTVAQWMSANYSDLKYDEQYATTVLRTFVPGDGSTYIAYSMRVLRMINLTKADRDLNIRMQYGLNSARDQLMYTAGTAWIARLQQSSTSTMLAYLNAGIGATTNGVTTKTVVDFEGTSGKNKIRTQMNESGESYSYLSPAVLCVMQANEMQELLEQGT